MARHIVCVLDRTVGHVSFCWDYVSIFIYKNSNYNKINQICHFYPTALKGCRGIVFTHGVRMGGRPGGRVGGRREIVCPGCISETVRCRKLILGRDIG